MARGLSPNGRVKKHSLYKIQPSAYRYIKNKQISMKRASALLPDMLLCLKAISGFKTWQQCLNFTVTTHSLRLWQNRMVFFSFTTENSCTSFNLLLPHCVRKMNLPRCQLWWRLTCCCIN